MVTVRLTLFGKPRCGLCEHAREVVEDVVDDLDGTVRIEFAEVDVNGDPSLKERYRLDIPVLRIDDTDAFKHRIDYDRLVARLLHGTPAPLEATQVPAP